jgi:hypothetical protein
MYHHPYLQSSLRDSIEFTEMISIKQFSQVATDYASGRTLVIQFVNNLFKCEIRDKEIEKSIEPITSCHEKSYPF